MDKVFVMIEEESVDGEVFVEVSVSNKKEKLLKLKKKSIKTLKKNEIKSNSYSLEDFEEADQEETEDEYLVNGDSGYYLHIRIEEQTLL